MATGTIEIHSPEALRSILSALSPPVREKLFERQPQCKAVVDALWWLKHHTRTKDEQDADNPYKPLPDYEYFGELYRWWLSEPVLFVEKSRTMMVTWFFAGMCLHQAMTREATSVIFWAQDEDRSIKVLDYCWTLWEQQDEPLKQMFALDRTRDRQAYNRMELRNGSWLLSLPGKDPDKIRSEHPSILMMDEACFIEHGGEAYDVALATRVPKIVVVSSAAPSWFRDLTKDAVPV